MTQQQSAAKASAKAREPKKSTIDLIVSLRNDGYSWDKISYLAGVTKKTAIKYYRKQTVWSDQDIEFSRILINNPGLKEWVLKRYRLAE